MDSLSNFPHPQKRKQEIISGAILEIKDVNVVFYFISYIYIYIPNSDLTRPPDSKSGCLLHVPTGNVIVISYLTCPKPDAWSLPIPATFFPIVISLVTNCTTVHQAAQAKNLRIIPHFTIPLHAINLSEVLLRLLSKHIRNISTCQHLHSYHLRPNRHHPSPE